MKTTLRKKLGLSLLGAMLCAAVIGGYFHYRAKVDELEKNLNIFAGTVGPLIEESLSHSMLTRNSQILRDTLKNIVNVKSIERVILVNNEGVVKAGSDPGDLGRKLPLPSPGLPSAAGHREGDGVFHWIQTVRNRPECFRCHDPQSARNGYVIVDFSAADMKKKRA